MISRDRFPGKKRVKKLDYPVYRKFLQVFLKKLERQIKVNLLYLVPYGHYEERMQIKAQKKAGKIFEWINKINDIVNINNQEV
jgi:hypothetical protein